MDLYIHWVFIFIHFNSFCISELLGIISHSFSQCLLLGLFLHINQTNKWVIYPQIHVFLIHLGSVLGDSLEGWHVWKPHQVVQPSNVQQTTVNGFSIITISGLSAFKYKSLMFFWFFSEVSQSEQVVCILESSVPESKQADFPAVHLRSELFSCRLIIWRFIVLHFLWIFSSRSHISSGFYSLEVSLTEFFLSGLCFVSDSEFKSDSSVRCRISITISLPLSSSVF